MSRLLTIRQKLNLTQEELFERTGISVRTIQRIEAGANLKGYTLKTLAKGLGVTEDELIGDEEPDISEDAKWLKVINLSALPFMFVPPLNIVVPLLIMFSRKQFTPTTRRLVTIQIIWSLIALLMFLSVMMLNDWFGIRSRYMLLLPLAWLLVNTFVILRNAVEIDKSNTLRIDTGFSFI